MTARDTHEMRLARWSYLATLPTTNAMLAVVMLLWLATGLCSLVGLTVPERWNSSLEVFTGIVVVQFTAKRFTHKPGEESRAAPPPVESP